MIYTPVFHLDAEKEFHEAIVHYESESEGLGIRFSYEILRVLRLVSQNPLICQITNRRYREAVVETFPYIIVYRIDDDVIFISSIFHTSRNPKKKYRK
jgi:plasmid stabilization system protein ParE